MPQPAGRGNRRAANNGEGNGKMNKIYKVIWNEVRHCFVYVSELAKSHHKPKSRKALAHDKDGKPTIERVRVNKDYPEHRNVIAKKS